LINAKMVKKNVRSGLTPHTSKTPRVDPTIKNPMDQKPVWHIGALDVDGPWGWNVIQKGFFFDEVLPKMRNFESMFWKDILGKNNHEVSVSKISTVAQKRLARIDLDDTEQLVSLRLTGKQRIWGIRVYNILRILWWDPNHQVYPSRLRHT